MTSRLGRILISVYRNRSRFHQSAVTKMTSSYAVDAVAEKPLDRKVAIVTASSRGIGYSIAKRLAEDGAHVIISSRRQDHVDKALSSLTAENLDVSGMTCHVGNSDDRSNLLKQTAEKHGRIDILVANTALNPQYDATHVEMSESRSDKLFNTNLQWSSFLMKETLTYMEPMRGGSIVFITSNSALVPFQQLETYGVSKTSLVGLTKTLVRQCSERNVRINCVAAELVKTECGNIMTENDFITHKKTGMAQPRLFGESQECAGTVSFLCSDDASAITGATIVMATGMDSRLRVRA